MAVFSNTIFICFQFAFELAWSQKGGELTETQRDQILNYHNKHRNDLDGEDRNGKHFQGVQKNMMKLRWHDGLEATAQLIADKCKKKHLPHDDELFRTLQAELPGIIGENLFGKSLFKRKRDVVKQYVSKWYKEYSMYNWKEFNCEAWYDNRLIDVHIEELKPTVHVVCDQWKLFYNGCEQHWNEEEMKPDTLSSL
ncbi:uncharacterized protein LOC142338030 [Convolutriloba macropyga]|uniref:uncharacterized protein LOC142338030 n=1 Tax=Convolutriloba macropyga TaxID=536237 RepID=UPI003F5209EA